MLKDTNIRNNNLPRFPLDKFPVSIVELVKEAREKLNFPIEITAAGILSAVSASIGNSLRIHTPLGWDDKPITWLCIVAPRGTAKSPALNRVLKPLGDIVSEKHKVYERELDIFEKSGKEGKKPLFVSSLIHDSTLEGIYKALKHNPHGVLTHSDELTGWAGNFARYTGGNDSSGFNTLFNGKQFIYNRKNVELSLYIEDPFWSIIGGLQPTLLSKIFDGEKIESGFFDRVQFVFPENTDYICLNGERMNPALWDNYDKGIRGILDIALNPSERNYLRVEDHEQWLKHYNIWGVCRNDLADTDPKRGLLSKAQTMYSRWCLIAHGLNVAFNDKPFAENITNQELTTAYNLTQFFYKSNSLAYDIATSTTPVDMLPNDKKMFYDAIPDVLFSRKEAIDIGKQVKMSRSAVDRFLADRVYFMKHSYGDYVKKY